MNGINLLVLIAAAVAVASAQKPRNGRLGFGVGALEEEDIIEGPFGPHLFRGLEGLRDEIIFEEIAKRGYLCRPLGIGRARSGHRFGHRGPGLRGGPGLGGSGIGIGSAVGSGSGLGSGIGSASGVGVGSGSGSGIGIGSGVGSGSGLGSGIGSGVGSGSGLGSGIGSGAGSGSGLGSGIGSASGVGVGSGSGSGIGIGSGVGSGSGLGSGIGSGAISGSGIGSGLGVGVGEGFGNELGGGSSFRRSEAGSIGLGESDRVRDRDSTFAKKGAIVAGNKKFAGNQQQAIREDVGNLHKHQNFNNEKLIVKDTTSANQDVDGTFKTINAAENQNFVGESNKVSALGGSIRNDRAKDQIHELGTSASGEKEIVHNETF